MKLICLIIHARIFDITQKKCIVFLERKLKFMPEKKALDSYIDARPWQLGFKDRGHGHGDYAILDRSGDLVAEMPDGVTAELVINAVNEFKTLETSFKIPKGMERRIVAETFAAYLIGSLAFTNRDRFHGPMEKDKGDDSSWQLDGSNDYWLHIEGDKARINCRNPKTQVLVVKVMVELFNRRYNR